MAPTITVADLRRELMGLYRLINIPITNPNFRLERAFTGELNDENNLVGVNDGEQINVLE